MPFYRKKKTSYRIRRAAFIAGLKAGQRSRRRTAYSRRRW